MCLSNSEYSVWSLPWTPGFWEPQHGTNRVHISPDRWPARAGEPQVDGNRPLRGRFVSLAVQIDSSLILSPWIGARYWSGPTGRQFGRRREAEWGAAREAADPWRDRLHGPGWTASHDDVKTWKHFRHYWPLWGESTGDRWIPLTKGQ